MPVFLHAWVIRTSPPFRGYPDDILGRVFNVAGLAMHAVLRVNLARQRLSRSNVLVGLLHDWCLK